MFNFKVFLLMVTITITTATLPDFDLDLDLSNLDLSKHTFFKNFPDLSKKPGATIMDHIDQHFQKKKTVALYFGRLLFGTPQDNEAVPISFDPNFGHAWRPHYQHKYGYRGQNFIDSIGKGYSPVIDRSMNVNRQRATRAKKTNSNFRIIYY